MAILCVCPFLLTAMIIGIIISLLQTITSIQDQTISFVPKLLLIILLSWILSHWLFRHLIEFTYRMLERASELAK